MLTDIDQATELYGRAVDASRVGHSAEATKLLVEALRALPVASGNPEATALRIKILAVLAYTEAETGSVADGLVYIGTASDLVGALPERMRPVLQGLVDNQYALILLRTGHTAEAVEVYSRAIPVLEQAADAGDPELLARLYLNRGLSYIELGRPGPAEMDLLRCIVEATAHPVPRLTAKAQNNLGDIAQLIGDIPGALRYYEEAEKTFKEIGPGLVPRARIDQARALLAAGLADEAARHLDEALPVLRTNRIGQDLAEAEVARAAAALLQGELDLAVELARSAHRRFVKRGSAPWAEVASLTRLQAETTAALNGQPSKASPRRAARLAERLAKLGLTDEAAKATLLAVRLALHRGAISAAESLLRQVPSPRRIAPIDHKMLLRLCKAELALARGDHKRTLAEARAGLAELSRVRDRMGGLDLVCGTAVHGIQLASLALGLLLEDARTPADARRLLAWQERTRAQIYRYEPLPAIEDPELANLVTELRTLMRTVQQARLARRPTAELEQRCEALQREVTRHGWHTSQWGRPRPVCSPKDIVDQLGDRALISFIGPGEELAAVVLAGGRTHLVRLGSLAEVLEVAKQLHADLDALAPDDLMSPLAAAVSASAMRRIGRLDELLRPVIELTGDGEVVIVPGGGLYQVPWGSLPALRGRPVSVAPSATAWVGATTRPTSATGEDVVLVCGPGLPESVTELTRLRAIYPDAVVLQGEAATTAAVLSTMDGARLVHIAAHGTHEPANALFSRLELADGGLLAHELARLHKPPEHVVLASCELALSHIRPGDEALGFAGALLATGSRTVIAAVCRVGDRSSAETMTDYHRWLAAPTAAAADLADTMADYHTRLASGAAPATALAQATAADPLRRPFICLGAG
ncbi:MAG TPA: CHAT domain-containing tetratricopeptide repeat protein [Actinophytocola sp.]|uniref:CHAT domain-containing protein n=1 Tax=Actinophytocola sp. TaxID=1872138 RepID=UPI002DDCE850|nr:CHAT domain-containing tetratricopeptide repeat protein [Actinophytocola sp.]HEV2781620.1 CHAT domain-containing tetratricopeptide repeat protein [Actinophytocola sp.]